MKEKVENSKQNNFTRIKVFNKNPHELFHAVVIHWRKGYKEQEIKNDINIFDKESSEEIMIAPEEKEIDMWSIFWRTKKEDDYYRGSIDIEKNLTPKDIDNPEKIEIYIYDRKNKEKIIKISTPSGTKVIKARVLRQ